VNLRNKSVLVHGSDVLRGQAGTARAPFDPRARVMSITVRRTPPAVELDLSDRRSGLPERPAVQPLTARHAYTVQRVHVSAIRSAPLTPVRRIRRTSCRAVSGVHGEPCLPMVYVRFLPSATRYDRSSIAQRLTRLVIAHEPEPFAGIAFVSRANQAAAFERMSRSSRS
jgi:hypothetical protein